MSKKKTNEVNSIIDELIEIIKKKTLALILAFMMCFVMTACDSGSKDDGIPILITPLTGKGIILSVKQEQTANLICQTCG